MPFFDSLPVILGIDMIWHGLPFWIVLNSRPLNPDDVNVVHSLLTVGTLGAAFLLFEKVRGIKDPSDTYGLKGIDANTPLVLTGIALTSCSFYSAAVDPVSFFSGWNELVATLSPITLSPANVQRIASSMALGGFYHMILLFGRLPGSGEEGDTFRNLLGNAIHQLKEMHKDHQLRTLWFVDSGREGTGTRVTGRAATPRRGRSSSKGPAKSSSSRRARSRASLRN